MQQIEKKPQLFVLIFLVSFASVGAVLFTPGLPAIADHYKISVGGAQLPVSLFLIGYAFGQLPWGPVANRIGRKPAIYLGVSFQIIGAVLSGIAGYFNMYSLFLVFIFLMALGSSVGLTMTFTLIGDAYENHEATKRIAYFGLSFAIAPGLAVALGGFLVRFLGWQSCFFFLSLYGVFLLILSMFLPETKKEIEIEALKIKRIFQGYFYEIKDRLFLLGAFIWGSVTAMIYLFAAMAPFIGLDRIGLKADEYGLFNLVPLVGLVLGSISARALVSFLSPLTAMALGICCILVGVLFQLLSFSYHYINFWTLFFPMPLIYYGGAFLFTNASSLALSVAKNKSNASSVLSFLNMGLAVIATGILSLIPNKKSLILPIFYAIIICLIVVAFCFLLKMLRNKKS